MNEKWVLGVLHIGMNHFLLALAAYKAHYDSKAFALTLHITAYHALVSVVVVHTHPRFLWPLSSISYYYATYSSEIYLFHNPFQIFIYHLMQQLGSR